jgi:hypothetical protein
VFLNIAIEDTERGVRSDINFNLQAIGVPDLEKQLSNLEVGGQPIQLVGLLGRDFLRHTIMTYRGGAASFEIVIDRGLFEVKPAV